ncbi:DEKNAAC104085 [Brettanomyces naardenensis]|uniref:Chromatin modification-related protein EAF3 n=1 Tax=Brettanomyces naardenensis TaxID=13370 RepID=A0A448YPY3_BRENA|nr:DEKNAAC104085 [Brettanomyces naardenensis]
MDLGDLVLVYQGPLLYDSKIIKIYYPTTGKVKYRNEKLRETVEGEPDSKFPQAYKTSKLYFIHYQGWNNKWNEWVLEDRVLERTTENLLLQKNLKLTRAQRGSVDQNDGKKTSKGGLHLHLHSNGKSAKMNGKAGGRSTALRLPTSSSSSSSSSTSRKDGHGHPVKRHELTVIVPNEIKLILVKDWQNITREEKLVSLPSKCSASKVLKDFSKKVCREEVDDDVKLDNYLEIIESVKIYFNQSLGSLLLYRYEREQYKETMKKYDRLEFADLYGAVFLLRLFSILPNIMIQSNMDLQSLQLVKQFIEEFYTWFYDNRKTYLIDEYENCMPLIPFLQ